MNWQAIGFDWNQARSFLATAREGSLSGAARALQTTQPTVGRHIDALEAELQVVLFDRGRRGLTLTSAGREVLEQVEAMATAAGRISLISAGQAREVEGEVSVTAVDFVCQRIVVPVASRLAGDAPGLSIRVLACDALRDLSRREADIAIRHVRPTQGDLVVRLAANWHAGFWASRDLLDRMGRPASPMDMKRYPMVGTEDPERFMALARDLGVPLEPDQFRHPVNSGMLVMDMVAAGLGVSFLPDAFCRNRPDLERIGGDFVPAFTFPVWLVTHRELHTSRRIRIVFDALGEALAEVET